MLEMLVGALILLIGIIFGASIVVMAANSRNGDSE